MQLIYKMLFLSVFFIPNPLLLATKGNARKAKKAAVARIKNTYLSVKEEASLENSDYKPTESQQLLSHYHSLLASSNLGSPRRIRFISSESIAEVFKATPRYAILLRMLKHDMEKELFTLAQEHSLLSLILKHDDPYALIAFLQISAKDHFSFLSQNIHTQKTPQCYNLWKCRAAFESALNCFQQTGLSE